MLKFHPSWRRRWSLEGTVGRSADGELPSLLPAALHLGFGWPVLGTIGASTRSLFIIEIRPLVRESRFCLLISGTNLAAVANLRGWAAIIPPAAVDLHGLCVSYQCVGAMGLPRDIIEEIVDFHREDTRTLKACSLTCRALFSAARGLIHERVRLPLWKMYPPPSLVGRIMTKVLPEQRATDWYGMRIRYLLMGGKHGLLGYAREVDIDLGHSSNFGPEALEACLPHFRFFTQVHTLRIRGYSVAKFLPAFGRHFTQLVPTLRSLQLPRYTDGVHEVVEFVCMFPHLDNLSLPEPLFNSLTEPSFNFVDVPPRSSVERSPPLRGSLVLRGWVSSHSRFLLKIPGGLHFRSISAGGAERAELDGILASCSSNLETLSLRIRSRKFTQYQLSSGEVCCRLLMIPSVIQ